jgi:prolipoprotein diacylglyceryltransferase
MFRPLAAIIGRLANIMNEVLYVRYYVIIVRIYVRCEYEK